MNNQDMNDKKGDLKELKGEVEKLKKDVYERSIEGISRSIKHIDTIAKFLGIFIVLVSAFAVIRTEMAKRELREDTKEMREYIISQTKRAEDMITDIKKMKIKVEEDKNEIDTIKFSVHETVKEIEIKKKDIIELVDNAEDIFKKTEKAQEAAEEAARVSKANRYFAEGSNMLIANMVGEAAEKFKLAIELDQEFVAAYLYWGTALYWMWKSKKESIYLEQALQKYDKAIEIEKNNYIAWYEKARVYSLLENKDKVLESLKKSIELNPKNKEEAKKDEDFKWLWEDEDFKKLVGSEEGSTD